MGVLRDIRYVDKLSDARYKYYSRVYFNTNENLPLLYKKVDFKDKSVLSVLSSSDHPFMAYHYGAREIDTFDRNKLTFYYYYLRLWTIKYLKEEYPHGIANNDYNWLTKLLVKVEPCDAKEKSALFFWRTLLDKKYLFSRMFFYSDNFDSSLFKSKDDLSNLENIHITYKNMDISKLLRKYNKKYDVIVLSNILEWLREERYDLSIARDGLYDLLNDDGIVLCSTVMQRSEKIEKYERSIFESDFSCQELGLHLGHVYKKVKCGDMHGV